MLRILFMTALLLFLTSPLSLCQAQEQVVFEDIPQPSFWLEGNAGPWGPGNPFYELETPLRKKLISYLNSHPSTVSQLQTVFAEYAESINQHVVALFDAKMIRAVDISGGKPIFGPTFAILSTSDLEMPGPLMLQAAEAYAESIYAKREQLDSILVEAGLDTLYRLPIFLAFIRDKIFYNHMEEKKLFPEKNGLCPTKGKGNFYGAESYPPLNSKQIYGLNHCMKNELSFVYIDPYFQSDSLFQTWGFEGVWEAKDDFSEIMKLVKRDKPTEQGKIIEKFQGKEIKEHIPAILAYLVEQNALAKSDQGYINASARLDKRTMKALEELSAPTTQQMAQFIGGQELAELFEKTTSRQNNISMAEFREAVAWQAVWATAGFLEQKGFFPDLSANGRELFVFER